MKKYTIVGIGELLFDVFPDRKALGGAPTNLPSTASSSGTKPSLSVLSGVIP